MVDAGLEGRGARNQSRPSNVGKGTASQQDVGRVGRKTGGRTWPWPARRHQEEDEVAHSLGAA